MAAMVFTRNARKVPSLSSASSASVTLSRACASLRKASERVLIHFTGRPMSLEASSTSGVSLKIGDFMPKLPPVSPVTMRSLLSGTFSTLARSARAGCGRCIGGVDGVAAVGGVVVADRAARLHGGGGDAVDDEAMFDDAVGAREGGIGRGLVADQLDEADIVGAIVPDARAARLRRLRRRGDRRQAARNRPGSVRRRRAPAPRFRPRRKAT